MKLWDKGYNVDQQIEQFTVGNDRILDVKLAPYDVKASIAHAQMLAKVGLITSEEGEALVASLETMLPKVSAPGFIIETQFEDIHSKIEHELIAQLGDTGKKIHTARSRNDQVLVAMHLFLKDELQTIKNLCLALFDGLMQAAAKHKDVALPGYTHLQVAMPSSFGLWFSAYAESLIDDLYLVDAALKVVDQNPLGSAAGYGSCFPVDREFTTQALGFAQLKVNAVAAQMSRGKSEKTTAYALASVAGTLSKFAMDVCLYMSQNFGFLSLSKEYTTGSSIMPHKKNPDVFELIRAHCNKISNVPNELTLITSNLPSGYHRDLQLLKETIVNAIEGLKSCLEISIHALPEIKVNTDIMNTPMYDAIYSVDTLNDLIANGISFRDAYKHIGAQIDAGTFTPNKNVPHTHTGSIGNPGLNLIKAKRNTK
jgi:argininosuccinate lyase